MAKRILSSSVDWNLISVVFKESGDAEIFRAFKSKSDIFARKAFSKPADLQKIDWEYYKSRITVPGLVESFKSGYENLKIPYPSDGGFLSRVDQNKQTYLKNYKEEMENIDKQVAELSEKLKNLEGTIMLSEMSNEEAQLYASEYINSSRDFKWLLPTPEEREKEY